MLFHSSFNNFIHVAVFFYLSSSVSNHSISACSSTFSSQTPSVFFVRLFFFLFILFVFLFVFLFILLFLFFGRIACFYLLSFSVISQYTWNEDPVISNYSVSSSMEVSDDDKDQSVLLSFSETGGHKVSIQRL